jgi:hypothetical protein
MRETGAIIITFVVDENLSFIFQPPECCCVQNPIPIALKNGPVFRLIFWMLASFAVLAADGVRRQELVFQFLKLLARMNHGFILRVFNRN